MPRRIVLALALSLPGLAAADVIHLKDGRSVEGEIVEEGGGKVKVKVKLGSVTLNSDDIESIERKPTPAQEYAERLKTLKPGSATEQLDLALWAESKKLEEEAIRHFLEALRLDPEVAPARAALERRDWHLVAGEWQDPDTYYRGRGWVRHEGRWAHPLEVSWRLSEKIVETLQKKTDAASVRLARAQAERDRDERAAETAAADQARASRALDAADRALPDLRARAVRLEAERADAKKLAEHTAFVLREEQARQQRGEPNAVAWADAENRKAVRRLAAAEADADLAAAEIRQVEAEARALERAIEVARERAAKAEEGAKQAAGRMKEAAEELEALEAQLQSAKDEARKAKEKWAEAKAKEPGGR
jgi:hypothetical protein